MANIEDIEFCYYDFWFLLLKSKMGLIIADFGEKREEGIWSLHPSG